ncbi:hypothetical protein HGRIS_007273 [Hohenbuehelia grisea]|uniref:Exoribonuclease phosphorolytic domain-containing protein n=1 Tax=Hohenbuehelia grisea TaxID=104357 RepID=A0ABR3JBK5_9AGAR
MHMSTRQDGRKNDDLRTVDIAFDGLARVDGSARFSFGPAVSSLSSVSGPIEVRLAVEQASKATFEVSVRPLSGNPGIEAKAIASSVRIALLQSLLLNQLPRTLIQLVVQALSPSSASTKYDFALISAMINSSTLALLNAGSIPMRGVVCAASVARLSSSSIVVDPSSEEASEAQAIGCFAFLFSADISDTPNDSDCTCVWSSWSPRSGNTVDESDVMQARDVAKGAARRIRAVIRDHVPTMDAGYRKPIKAKRQVEEENDESMEAGSEDDEDKMEI